MLWKWEDVKINQIKDLVKNWIFWLIIISGIAIILRSIPGWIYAAWGCDFGIYYQITNSVVTGQELFPVYIGWGGSYNEFPVLYAITALAHWITGIDIIVLMPKLIPIFGGLTVFIYYFLVNELVKNKKIALLSTLLLAVMPFHVNQLSHSSPLTIGHFFMIISLYLFLKYRKNVNFILPLFISTILLIMSHHFTTYIYLISLIFIIFVENIYKENWTKSFRRDIYYIILASALTFAYWGIVARTVYESYMQYGLSIGNYILNSNVVVLLFYLALFFSFGLIKLRRKYVNLSKNKKVNSKSSLIKFIFALVICLSLMISFAIIDLPWVNFAFTPQSILWSLPLLIIFAFVVAGIKSTRITKNGLFLRGWIAALVISFLFGIVSNSGAILPHRHVEYMMYPISIIAVYGIGSLFSDFEYKKILSNLNSKKDLMVGYFSQRIKLSQKKRLIHLCIILIIFTLLAASIYPLPRTLKQSNEVISQQDLNAIDWIGMNLDKNHSVVASDHRLERLVESKFLNTTQDQTNDLWNKENMTDFINDLIGIGKNYSRISHVLIDDIMTNDVVHVGYAKPGLYMTNDTWSGGYDKFGTPVFKLIYRNESIDTDSITLEPINWVEIYEVNWTYIEERMFI